VTAQTYTHHSPVYISLLIREEITRQVIDQHRYIVCCSWLNRVHILSMRFIVLFPRQTVSATSPSREVLCLMLDLSMSMVSLVKGADKPIVNYNCWGEYNCRWRLSRAFNSGRLNAVIAGKNIDESPSRPWRRKRTVTRLDGPRVESPWMSIWRPPIEKTFTSVVIVAWTDDRQASKLICRSPNIVRRATPVSAEMRLVKRKK